MARRFIVKEHDINQIDENMICIRGSEVKHIQVLRHNVGEKIQVNEYICEIVEIKKEEIILQKIALAPKVGEPNIHLTLFVAMLKGDKMDLVVQKAVELGCKKIVPFFSKNVIVKLDEKGRKKRKEKLQIVADEACKQCGRTDRVEVSDFISFQDMVSLLTSYLVNFFAYEKEKENLHEIMTKTKESKFMEVSCIIGPEGGFDEKEAQILNELENVKSISLGSRILRAETACFYLISVIMYELDR